MTNIFALATREKLRFASTVGELSVEQVWDLPLTSIRESKPSLDLLARETARQLREYGEESFVEVKPNPAKVRAELKLEVLKAIIAVRQEENAAAKKAAENAERRRKLLEALANKEQEGVAKMSEEDIRKELAALGG